jgi:hypothetical protein
MDNWGCWAEDAFGGADLGDARRTRRLVQMAAQVGRRPCGRISAVFDTDAERQGAYDFIESPHISAERIRRSITADTARRSRGEDWVYVPLDGTSLKLWDGTGKKDFGSIGTYANGAAGLKLYNAIAVSASGVPIGVAAQVWWRRPRERVVRRPHVARNASAKETGHLLEAIDQVVGDFAVHAPRTRCWFQIDRGGDSQLVLRHLARTDHWFTIRAHVDRPVLTAAGKKQSVWKTLREQRVIARLSLRLPRTEQRRERVAHLAVRTARVVLRLRNKWTHQLWRLPINAVLVTEIRATTGDRIEWLLFTNHDVVSRAAACKVVAGYTRRWRIEEFHKTWKSGACDVENSQLHSSERVIRWATLLSAVAARIERLKYLSRTEPDAPASAELTPPEIKALLLLKKKRLKKGELLPKKPTIGQATLWIAQLGGYTGKSSGGPPGTITLTRGLERLQPAAELLAALLDEDEK